jgi:large subunit ribosomal protein L35
MAAASQSMRPLAICSRCLKSQKTISLPLRTITTSARFHQAAPAPAASSSPAPLVPTAELDPNLVATVSEEKRLIKHRNLYPVGSRRRRAALSSGKDNIPFEQLPYQCFQEARNVLAQDREEKMQAIAKMRKRIAHVEGLDAAAAGGEPHKQHRLFSMRKELENLKILADINDPMVKKRFEDGLGMSLTSFLKR